MWDSQETFAFIFDRGLVELLPCENFLNLPIVALKGKFALNINECLLPDLPLYPTRTLDEC